MREFQFKGDRVGVEFKDGMEQGWRGCTAPRGTRQAGLRGCCGKGVLRQGEQLSLGPSRRPDRMYMLHVCMSCGRWQTQPPAAEEQRALA